MMRSQFLPTLSRIRKKHDSDGATGVDYCVASSLSWSKSIRPTPHQLLNILSKVNTLKFEQVRTIFPRGLLKLPSSPVYPHSGWTIGGRVHHKVSARKVTHPSTILALGSLTSESPWDA